LTSSAFRLEELERGRRALARLDRDLAARGDDPLALVLGRERDRDPAGARGLGAGDLRPAEAPGLRGPDLLGELRGCRDGAVRAFQCIWDTSNPPGVRAYLRGAHLRELPDECIDTVVARANLPAASLSYVFLRPLGGALPDVGWAYQCVGLWPPVRALDPGQVAWVDGFVEAVGGFG
jgi:hypothetical protein